MHVGKAENGPSQSPFSALERRQSPRRKTTGNRVLMFGRIRELALYRAEVLRDRGFQVATPENLEEAVAAIRRGGFDIAVLTYTLSNSTVLQLSELIREYCPDCPLIVISGSKWSDREVRPDGVVKADQGPAALVAALRRVTRTN
jgi:DNA-binding NarL/FixJ family response regulator